MYIFLDDIYLFTSYVSPKSILGLETSCPDSYPYDTFTLTCRAEVNIIQDNRFSLTWYHDESIREGTITTDRTHIINTLRFPNSSISDSGNYTCKAFWNSQQTVIIGNITVSLKGKHNDLLIQIALFIFLAQSLPFAAIDLSATMKQITAAIAFTIPAIAYTPEKYHIEYSYRNMASSTVPIFSAENMDIFTATDRVFQVSLTGLEEDTTYNYTIISTNCIGSTSTAVMNFTTLPSCE